ncbi:12546_t:CDS:1, partial [Dentiscutata heterogama]
VYNIQVEPSTLLQGELLHITWDIVNPEQGWSNYITWVSVDDNKKYDNIIWKSNMNTKEYYWPVNLPSGSYYIFINNLKSNTFFVTEQESDIKNINSGGRSYMCVDTGEAGDTSGDDYSDTPDDGSDYSDTPDDGSDYSDTPDDGSDSSDTPDDGSDSSDTPDDGSSDSDSSDTPDDSY